MKSYSIDSRTIKPGDIFIAIKGKNFDGHNFIFDAFQKGASCAIVNHDYRLGIKNLIRVSDTVKALQNLAKTHLKQIPARRVAITGSSGKTTTKELTAACVRANFGIDAVSINPGNLNNEIGVPISALEVKPHHKVAIFEMGSRHHGDILLLSKIIDPEIGLITNIGSAHSATLGNHGQISKAKFELFETFKKNNICIINADDPHCLSQSNKITIHKKLYFGKKTWADIRILDSIRPTFSFQDTVVTINYPLLGFHNIHNAAGALSISVALGCDFKKSAYALEQIQLPSGRLQKHFFTNNIIVLNDTYNANPESMLAGINVLASFKSRRKIAVLGSMTELGKNSKKYHRAIAANCFKNGVDLLFSHGQHAVDYYEGALAAGMSASNFLISNNNESLAYTLINTIKPGDIIWIKGSKSVNMEEIFYILKNNIK